MKDELAAQRGKRGTVTVTLRGGSTTLIKTIDVPIADLRDPVDAMKRRARKRKPTT